MTAATIEQATLAVTYTRPNKATVAHARTWLTTYLTRRGHTGAAADGAILALSELFTNAVIHALPPIAISAHLPADLLTLTVTDRPGKTPAGHEDPYESAEHGRGLLIIAALAQSLTETTSGDRHTVTAAIPLGDSDLPGFLAGDPAYPAI